MSSSPACNHFQLHAWKKDTCANCLKPRKQHALDETPKPTKRLSKVTTSGETTKKSDEARLQVDVQEKSVQNLETGKRDARHLSDQDIKRQSVIGSPKPVPLKAKPLLVSNADKARKPGGVSETEDKTDAAKPLEKQRDSIQDPSCHLDSLHVGELSQNENSSLDSDKSTIGTAQKPGRLKARPQMTPPQVPDQGRIQSNQSVDRASARTETKSKDSSNSHYYQIYDISAKGLSGMPEPLDAPKEKEMAEDGTDTRPKTSGIRAVELIEDPQNAAMPYNVVDVTSCPLTKDQATNKTPPRLPSTPAPNRISGVPFGASSTLPSNRAPSTKDLAEIMKGAVASPKTLRRSFFQDVSKPRVNDSHGILSSDFSSTDRTVISCEEKSENEDPNKDLYEDIGGCGNVTSRQSSPLITSGNEPPCSKSPAFEARVAALAKLDLGRTVSQGMPTASIITTEDVKAEDSSEKIESSDAASESKTGDVSTISRQEKGRKSGGKSFFQKFLKRGNKESVPEQPSFRSSNGNITIEPVLNICSAPAGDSLPDQSSSVDALPSGPALPRDKPSLSALTANKKPLCEVIEINAVSEESGKRFASQEVSSAEICSELETNKQSFSISDSDKDLMKSRTLTSQLAAATDEILAKKKGRKENLTLDDDSRLRPAISLPKFNLPFDGQGVDASKATGDKEEAPVDSSPTVDPFDRQFSTLTRNDAQKDTKPNKAPRKMVAPPPMAPPPPPSSNQSTGSKEAKLTDGAFFDATNTQRSISPSFLNSAKSGSDFVSHTLPRRVSGTAGSSVFVNSAEAKTTTAVGMRQLDLATRNARCKTMSEGTRFEKALIVVDEAEGNKTKVEELSGLSDRLERRASKFLNRALPDPPPQSETQAKQLKVALDEIDDLYELVSQSDTTGAEKDEQMTYEDIDIYCKNPEGGSKSSSSSSHHSGGAQKQCPALAGNTELGNTGCNYYLEPVPGREEEQEARGRAQSKDTWRPCPAPRASHLAKAAAGGEREESSMPYVNTRMMNDRVPLNTSDGFDAMAGLIVNILYHLTDRLYSRYVTQFLKNRSDVVWTDFELLNVKPEIVQETATFFRVKHLILAPSGCILMVFPDGSLNPGLSLEPSHANVISPMLCFPLTTNDFEIITGISGESSLPPRTGVAAVLLCDRLSAIDKFWDGEHVKAGTDSDFAKFERSVCHCLVEVLGALLYLRESGCSVLRLLNDDVLMAKFSDARWHPLVKPSVMTFDVCADQDAVFLGEDLTQLICRMLRIESSKGDRVESKIILRTKYSRGLQRVLRMLQQKTLVGLESCRNLLEFLLWGPSEEEARSVAMTEAREASFRVWLEVARCRMTSELVLHADRDSLELANQAKFLCRVTENSLLGITKLLFE